MADKGWLVLGEVRGLDLEGRVLNRHREVTGHAFAYLVQHLRGMPVGEALILDHHMRGQGGQASGDRRCVQVVHVGDVFELKTSNVKFGGISEIEISLTDANVRSVSQTTLI
mgnify:CR=1 FL=1